MAKKRPPAKSTSKRRRSSRGRVASLPKGYGGRPRVRPSCVLGEVIDKLAAARRMSFPEVAEGVGISLQALHKIRRGDIRPRLQTLERIADVLEVGPGRLLPR